VVLVILARHCGHLLLLDLPLRLQDNKHGLHTPCPHGLQVNAGLVSRL